MKKVITRAIRYLGVCMIVGGLLSCSPEISRQSHEPELPKAEAPLENQVQPDKDVVTQEDGVAGEIFGVLVPLHNYYFAKKVILTFSAKWRGSPKDEQHLEDLVWQELILSYEAFQRGIVASSEEKEREIEKILKADKVAFDWKKDKEAYENWVREKLGESVELFEHQMGHLVQLEKLRQQILLSIEPDVSEQEARQKFLDEHNTLSVELIRFDDLKEAENFYKQAKGNSRFWKNQKKENPDRFKHPGFVALDFLINIWGFRREDAYAMMKKRVGSFYKPTPIYRGYGVFKILNKRKANPKAFKKNRDRYYKRVAEKKKYEGFHTWKGKLKEEAQIKVYIDSSQIQKE
ncbi:MAG: hypothetical protein JSW40_10195 [Candidatus Omnitrophota bacterium]|nr:MAG: hypothetical protein JSW40_10195 [Candidatus Omnitrophota bacterium]